MYNVGIPEREQRIEQNRGNRRNRGNRGLNRILPLKNTTFFNFLGTMGYMSVKDENFPRANGVLRGKED